MSWYALKEPERTPEEEAQGRPPFIAYQLVEEGERASNVDYARQIQDPSHYLHSI